MKKVLLLACIAASLGACTTLSSEQLQKSQHYQVEWIGERPLIDRSMLTLILGDNHRASGMAGCNTWFAEYQLNADKLTLHSIGTTRKLCAPALMEQEQRFLAALTQVKRWELTKNQQLLLWPDEGAAIKLWPIEKP